MGEKRGAVGPLLEEHQPEPALAVDMHRMRDAAWLPARTMNMFEAEAARLLKCLGPDRYTASHYDHASSPSGRR
jgi:hypothetical protein